MACRRRALQLPRHPLSFRISSSCWSKMSLISRFSGGSRKQFPLASSAPCRQYRTYAGPVPSEARSIRLPLLLTTFTRLEFPLRHPPSIPPQVQPPAAASNVCKSGVRGAPHLTRIIDLESYCLARMCSPCVSSITIVAGLYTPLAPLSSSIPPCRLNGTSSLLSRHSSQFIGFGDRQRPSLSVFVMGHFLFSVGFSNPIRLQGPHLMLSVSRPTLMWGEVGSPGPSLSSLASFSRSVLPLRLWRCLSISITVLLSCGAVRLRSEDAAGFVLANFRGVDWMATSQFKVTISELTDLFVKATLTHSNTVLNLMSSFSFEDLSFLFYVVVIYDFDQRGWTIPSTFCKEAV